MDDLNDFERLLRDGMADGPERDGIRAVADTCYAAREWFRSYGVEASAAELLTFARLALIETDQARLLRDDPFPGCSADFLRANADTVIDMRRGASRARRDDDDGDAA